MSSGRQGKSSKKRTTTSDPRRSSRQTRPRTSTTLDSSYPPHSISNNDYHDQLSSSEEHNDPRYHTVPVSGPHAVQSNAHGYPTHVDANDHHRYVTQADLRYQPELQTDFTRVSSYGRDNNRSSRDHRQTANTNFDNESLRPHQGSVSDEYSPAPPRHRTVISRYDNQLQHQTGRETFSLSTDPVSQYTTGHHREIPRTQPYLHRSAAFISQVDQILANPTLNNDNGEQMTVGSYPQFSRR